VRILSGHLARIEQLARIHTYEICGLLSMLPDGTPTMMYECVNIHPKPEHHYAISSHQHFKAFNHMQEQGAVLAAIYHSHPKHPPIPSDEDIRTAFYPDAVYIITGRMDHLRQSSLDNSPFEMDTRAYHIIDGRATPTHLELESTACQPS
jgi:proteasome lid subunit RPN8/RPN11